MRFFNRKNKITKVSDIEIPLDIFVSSVSAASDLETIKWTWEKIKEQTLETRRVRNQPEILEWFEYLYNEMKKREQRQ